MVDINNNSIRTCLKMIRDISTMPSDILPNGKSASETAHEYVMLRRGVYNMKRNKTRSIIKKNKKK